MKLRDLIKNKRNEMDLSQRDLADKLGISFSTISKWERGAVKEISLTNFRNMIEVLGIDMEDLKDVELDEEINSLIKTKDPFEPIKLALMDYALTFEINSVSDLQTEDQARLIALALACMNDYLHSNGRRG